MVSLGGQDMSPRMATRHARMRAPRLAALGLSVGPSGGGRTPGAQVDGVDVGGRAVASVPFDAGSGDHGGAVVVLPDEIGGGFGLLGLARFDPLQIADDVGVVAPVFHCFAVSSPTFKLANRWRVIWGSGS